MRRLLTFLFCLLFASSAFAGQKMNPFTGKPDFIGIDVMATDCSSHTTEGKICWDTDDDKLYVGNGSTVTEIASGAGAGDITAVGDCAADAAFTGACGTTLTSNTDLIFALDDDANGSESFQILDGADATVVEILESGLITSLVGFDGIGAIDLDYGSADITDHTFVTDDATVIIDGGITISTGDHLVLGVVQWDNGSDAIDGEQIANDTIDDDSIDFADVTCADLTMSDCGAITSSGAVTADSVVANLFDTTGAADMDYGSADVTDHTFTTDDATVIIDGGITISTGDHLTLGVVQWDNGSDYIDGEQIANDTIDDDSIDFTDITCADLTTSDCGAITSSGAVTADSVVANLFDVTGAADMDYGSADVTDHTFTTDDATVIIDGGITISTGDHLTLGVVQWDNGSDAIDGEQIADDTIDDDSIDFADVTLADLTDDVGYEEETHASEHAVSAADTIFPADPDADKCLQWDDDPGALAWTDCAGPGGATAYDDIGDPDAATSISFADNETITYSTAEDTGTFFKIDDTDAALADVTVLQDLYFSGADYDGTANAVYLQMTNNSYTHPTVYIFTGSQFSAYRPVVSYYGNAAGGGATAYTAGQNLEAMDGADDYVRGYYVGWTNANHSNGSVYGFDAYIDAGDADAVETAFKTTGEWDNALDANAKKIINASTIESGNRAMTIGDATTDSITFTSDGTGNAEFTFPNDVIGDADIDWGTGAGQVSGADISLTDAGAITTTSLVDIGGGQLEIPQNSAGDSVGEIDVDTTDDQFGYFGASRRILTYKQQKCFALETPTDADDDIPIFFPTDGITVLAVYCMTEGGTSIAMTISDGTNALEAITCDADGQADDGSITNGTFTANEEMQVDFAAPTGTVDWVTACITYSTTAE